MGTRGQVIATLAALGLVVTGCSSGQDEPGGGETVTVTATGDSASSSPTKSESPDPESSSSETSQTSETPSSSPTTQDVASGLPTNPGDYADEFVRAWGIGDRPKASRYATESAADDIFAHDGRGGSTWEQDSTAVQGTRTQVRYTNGNGASLYVLVDTATAGSGLGDAVVGANIEWDDTSAWSTDDDAVPEDDSDEGVTGLPSTVNEYCDALVRAWGNNDRSAAEDYATSSTVSQLFDDHTPGQTDWARTSSTSSSATYTNDAGDTVTIHVHASRVSSGRGDAAYSAGF